MISETVKRLQGVVSRAKRRPDLDRALRVEGARLLASADGDAMPVGDALLRELALEERRWDDRIERVRRKLEMSREVLTFVDFGAGSPRDVRTPDDMRRGSVVTSRVGNICRTRSKSRRWGKVLFALVRAVRPERCLELGTALGISAAYVAAALEMNGRGRLITLEGAEPFARLARSNLSTLGLRRVEVRVGRFADTLDAALRDLTPVDFAFIDGHHDEAATTEYFYRLLPYLSDRALLVFDDVNWSDGMRRAWDHIRQSPRARFFADLGEVGVVRVGGAG